MVLLPDFFMALDVTRTDQVAVYYLIKEDFLSSFDGETLEN